MKFYIFGICERCGVEEKVFGESWLTAKFWLKVSHCTTYGHCFVGILFPGIARHAN